MIRSGSHTPGVSPSDFRLPPGTALRYERPAAAVARYVTGYAVLDSDPVEPDGTRDWILPSSAHIWIVFAHQPIDVRIGNRRYAALPTASLIGPSSRAMPVTTNGGVSIVVDISPVGWARLFQTRADALADRIVPLDTVLPVERVAQLRSALRDSDQALEVKAILDGFFATALSAPPHPDEEVVERLMAAVMDDTVADAAAAARRVGIDPRALTAIARRHFGFTTMTLLLRTRFLKAMLPMIASSQAATIANVPARYHDISHFNRDGHRFLGMTPRRFLALHKPYCEAVIRARALVIGSPMSALDGKAMDHEDSPIAHGTGRNATG